MPSERRCSSSTSGPTKSSVRTAGMFSELPSAFAQAHGAVVPSAVVAVGMLPEANRLAQGRIVDERGRRPASLQRQRIDERLERGARLTAAGHRVDVAAGLRARHRPGQHLRTVVIDNQHRAIRRIRLFEQTHALVERRLGGALDLGYQRSREPRGAAFAVAIEHMARKVRCCLQRHRPDDLQRMRKAAMAPGVEPARAQQTFTDQRDARVGQPARRDADRAQRAPLPIRSAPASPCR